MQPPARTSDKRRILTPRRLIEPIMNPLRFLVGAFVNTFGITQPAPAAEARAGRFILLMLASVVLVIGAAAWLLHDVFTR